MAYTINRYDGSQLTQLPDATIDDRTCDINLIGRNYAGYGEAQNENFVFLLENFARSTQPSHPLSGQIWYDSSTKKIKFFDGSTFISTARIEVCEPTPPTNNRIIGDLWFNTVDKQLFTWDGANFILVGPEQSATEGITKMLVSRVKDTSNVDHIIIQAIINDNTIFTISNDPEYALSASTPIAGFNRIYTGTTLVNTPTDGVTTSTHRYWGTASDAEKLGGLDPDQYHPAQGSLLIPFKTSELTIADKLTINTLAQDDPAVTSSYTNRILSFNPTTKEVKQGVDILSRFNITTETRSGITYDVVKFGWNPTANSTTIPHLTFSDDTIVNGTTSKGYITIENLLDDPDPLYGNAAGSSGSEGLPVVIGVNNRIWRSKFIGTSFEPDVSNPAINTTIVRFGSRARWAAQPGFTDPYFEAGANYLALKNLGSLSGNLSTLVIDETGKIGKGIGTGSGDDISPHIALRNGDILQQDGSTISYPGIDMGWDLANPIAPNPPDYDVGKCYLQFNDRGLYIRNLVDDDIDAENSYIYRSPLVINTQTKRIRAGVNILPNFRIRNGDILQQDGSTISYLGMDMGWDLANPIAPNPPDYDVGKCYLQFNDRGLYIRNLVADDINEPNSYIYRRPLVINSATGRIREGVDILSRFNITTETRSGITYDVVKFGWNPTANSTTIPHLTFSDDTIVNGTTSKGYITIENLLDDPDPLYGNAAGSSGSEGLPVVIGVNNRIWRSKFIGTSFEPDVSNPAINTTIVRFGSRARWAAQPGFTDPYFEAGVNYLALKNLGSITGTSIVIDGNNKIGRSSSDRRLKTNITSLANGLDFVNSANPVSFKFISNPNDVEYGFIAQDLKKSGYDALVVEFNDAGMQETVDENGYVSPANVQYSVKYDSVIPLLTSAIKEMKAEYDVIIAELRQEIANLKAS